MAPKRPLRSSEDVYHRLKWSGEFPLDRIRIGYEDRHSGTMEMELTEFYPGGRIPWSRVWYFVLDGERIWDRATRKDRVFGSGESKPEEIWRENESPTDPEAGGDNYKVEWLRWMVVEENAPAPADAASLVLKMDFVVAAGSPPSWLPALAGWYRWDAPEGAGTVYSPFAPSQIQREDHLGLRFSFNAQPFQFHLGPSLASDMPSVAIHSQPLETDLWERLQPDTPHPDTPHIAFASPHAQLVPWQAESPSQGILVATFLLNPSYRHLAEAPITHRSALAYVPPPHLWGPIQSIRRDIDPDFSRWMPHINLLYGFIPDALFPAAAAALSLAFSEEASFSLEISGIGHFEQRRKTVLWWKPDAHATDRFRQLQEICQEVFPQCTEQDRHGDFQPHLTIAKIPGQWNAMDTKQDLEKVLIDWKDEVGALCLLSRRGDGPMVVRKVIPWDTGAGKKHRFRLRDQNLTTALAMGGLQLNALELVNRRKADALVKMTLQRWDTHSRHWTVGLSGLDIKVPAVGLDLLVVGRQKLAAFQQFWRENDGVDTLEGSRLQTGGLDINLAYVSYPEDIPLVRPSQLPTEAFKRFSDADQAVLTISLEVAALRRHLDAGLAIFGNAFHALQLWTSARNINQPQWGYPSIMAWLLMLAGTEAEEMPEKWLENMFQRLIQHDWRNPLTVREGYYTAQFDAPMQVLSVGFPPTNTTSKVPSAILLHLQEEFRQGLDTIWRIQRGEASWLDFFSSPAPSSETYLSLTIGVTDTDAQAAARGWIEEQAWIEELSPLIDGPLQPMGEWTADTGTLQTRLYGKLNPSREAEWQPLQLSWRRQFRSAFPEIEFEMAWHGMDAR